MNPADRVKFVVETAKAVLDDRLGVADGAAAVQLQAEQLIPLLRTDRDSVTRSECESVATNLRMLAEQINDLGRRARPAGRDAIRTRPWPAPSARWPRPCAEPIEAWPVRAGRSAGSVPNDQAGRPLGLRCRAPEDGEQQQRAADAGDGGDGEAAHAVQVDLETLSSDQRARAERAEGQARRW